MLKNILSHWYKYVFWALMSLFFWGWVFTLLTDARPAHKLVLCVEQPGLRDAELQAALSDELPEGVRQIAVHPFDYYIFDTDELLHADLYLVPERTAEKYVESFRPIADTGFDRAGREVWTHEGAALGLYLTDEAASFLSRDERWLLCFGAQGAHQDDGKALWLAERVLALK